MMNEQQISDRLVAAHSAYVAKTRKQPYIAPMLTISTGSAKPVIVGFYGASLDDRIMSHAKTISAALDNIDATIAAIPSAVEQARNAAAKAVADAIEKCRAAGYDANFINPLIAMSKRISENALTHEAEE